MENHDTTTSGRVLIQSYDPLGNVVSSMTVSVPSLNDRVTGYSLVQGDGKHPTNFAYQATRDNGYKGHSEKIETFPTFYKSSSLDGSMGSFLSNRLPTLTWSRDAIYNRALSRFYEKVRGQLDLSVAVAEGHQTARMLNVYDRVAKAFEGVPPAKAGFRWTQPLRALGGRWLEWHLGIRPLLQDLYGSIDEFYRHKVPALLTVQAKIRQPLKDLPVAKLYAQDPDVIAKVDGIEGCIICVRLKDNGGFDLNRWTSLNPASIAWELLPLSFVIDYFYDIGNMLRNLESSLLYESVFVDGYRTELFTAHCNHREVGVRGKTSTERYFYDTTASYDVTRFERSVLSSMPTPRLPTFKLPTSWQQLFTMAALCAVRLNPHAKKSPDN